MLFTITCILFTLFIYFWIITFWMFLIGFRVALESAANCCDTRACEWGLVSLGVSAQRLAFPFSRASSILSILVFYFFSGIDILLAGCLELAFLSM